MFCGAGGSSAGARAAGAEIVAGVDVCTLATRTFADNFPGAQVISDCLENLDPGLLKPEIGDIDLLLASPECTNHTCAKGGALRSEESRATAMQVVRYAEALRPRWLILESVIHMRPWSRYGELKEELDKLGYHPHEYVLDSADFGVAQRRRRLFLVGDLERTPLAISSTLHIRPFGDGLVECPYASLYLVKYHRQVQTRHSRSQQCFLHVLVILLNLDNVVLELVLYPLSFEFTPQVLYRLLDPC